MENTAAIILAAGDGLRMKSKKPKVLCEVLFKPMILWVTDACRKAGVTKSCVVLGSGGDAVEKILPEGTATARQEQRLGTGHAAMTAKEFLTAGGFEDVLVLYGDTPLVCPKDIEAAYRAHREQGRALTLFTERLADPTGYGRIIRAGDDIAAIVEQQDTDAKTAAIDEVNAGVYWFSTEFLLEYFENMQNNNAKGEYYLTDALGYAVKTGRRAGAYTAANAVPGANDREGLAVLNEAARARIIAMHRENGVNIPFSDGVVIGGDVQIGADTTILPGSILRGSTHVGEDCEIGPNSYLDNAVLGSGCRIISSYIDSSRLDDNVKIGPMSNVRPNCHISSRAKIGDFVELKNSNIGAGTAVAHLTYVGDSDVGSGCNFGCGVVTVNFDGSKKYRTVIGDNVFIGCNTNLVAPVKLGNRVYTAAGTTVTEDVPDDALAIGRARQSNKLNWTKERGRYNK